MIGLVVGGFVLNQSTQRHEVDTAYAQLRAQVAASRARFGEIAAALGKQQRFLLDLVKSRSIATATPLAESGNSSVATAPAGTDPVQQTLTETAADLAAITPNNRVLGQQLATIESHVGALDEARERAVAARDRYAVALRSTASELAMQYQQVATLSDSVTVLRTEVATLDGSRRRAAAARDYYADAWHETEGALVAQRERSSSLSDQVAALRTQIDGRSWRPEDPARRALISIIELSLISRRRPTQRAAGQTIRGTQRLRR
jgi:chromosome segregation ATPase